MFLLLWQQKPQNEFCHDTLHAKILCQNLRHSSFWNLQTYFLFSQCQSLIFVDCSPHMFNILRCSACCRPPGMWITFNRFSTTFEAFVPHLYLCCTHCTVPKSLLNPPNSFRGGIVSAQCNIWCKFIALLRHFECDGHTVHMLTQWCLPPPLTSAVKSSLFTHAPSSPLSLAARLHVCYPNCSYINDGWDFSGQTSYMYAALSTYLGYFLDKWGTSRLLPYLSYY